MGCGDGMQFDAGIACIAFLQHIEIVRIRLERDHRLKVVTRDLRKTTDIATVKSAAIHKRFRGTQLHAIDTEVHRFGTNIHSLEPCSVIRKTTSDIDSSVWMESGR